MMIALKGNNDLENKVDFPHIYSVNDLSKIINIEKFRSDRNDTCFLLIMINVNNYMDCFGDENKISNLISSKIRDYDKVGWVDENHLAILLPETSENYAIKIAKKNIFRFWKKGYFK